MTAGPIHVIVDTSWWSAWLPLIASLIGSLVAVGIAVGSALRDNRLRKRDRSELARQVQDAASHQGLLEAQKVVIHHIWAVNGSCWNLVNAGDGPILDVQIYGGRGFTGDGHPAIWSPNSSNIRPVVLGREQASFLGTWWDDERREITDDQYDGVTALISGEYPIVAWVDGAGRRWITDEPTKVARPRKIATVGEQTALQEQERLERVDPT